MQFKTPNRRWARGILSAGNLVRTTYKLKSSIVEFATPIYTRLGMSGEILFTRWYRATKLLAALLKPVRM